MSRLRAWPGASTGTKPSSNGKGIPEDAVTSGLKLTDLHVSYGAVQALRGISVEVAPGEKVALLGANGAGKTTTLRAISGLVPAQKGEIAWRDRPIQNLPPHRITSLGISQLPEGRDLFPSLSVEENLKLGHWPKRKDRSDYRYQLDKVMDYFPRLKERRRQTAKTLSGGEQQMLGVARGLMSSPQILLVDELSLGLAPKIVELLFEIIEAINRDGTSVLLVEQFVHMALEHTNRAYVLAKGGVVLEGASADLLSSPDLVASYLGEVG